MGVLSFGLFYLYGFFYFNLPPYAKPGKTYVKIPANSTSYEVAKILKEKNIIHSELLFIFTAYITELDKKIPSGVFFMKKNLSECLALKSLTRKIGLLPYVRVTIPEGATLREITSILKKELNIDTLRFKNLSTDEVFLKETLKKLEIEKTPNTLEGYLFPDTYFYSFSVNEEDIIYKMIDRLKEVLFSLGWDTLKEKSSFDLHEVLTLASIVEKEAVVDSEKPLIAGVFYNRLKANIPLQADPTVKYILPEKKARLSYQDIKINSPYNTYLYPGLPSGPIASPGKASIKAVLYPQKTPYFYFVAKGDGTHYFSKSLKEHKKMKKIAKKMWNF